MRRGHRRRRVELHFRRAGPAATVAVRGVGGAPVRLQQGTMPDRVVHPDAEWWPWWARWPTSTHAGGFAFERQSCREPTASRFELSYPVVPVAAVKRDHSVVPLAAEGLHSVVPLAAVELQYPVLPLAASGIHHPVIPVATEGLFHAVIPVAAVKLQYSVVPLAAAEHADSLPFAAGGLHNASSTRTASTDLGRQARRAVRAAPWFVRP